jgi:hypothetical protein
MASRLPRRGPYVLGWSACDGHFAKDARSHFGTAVAKREFLRFLHFRKNSLERATRIELAFSAWEVTMTKSSCCLVNIPFAFGILRGHRAPRHSPFIATVAREVHGQNRERPSVQRFRRCRGRECAHRGARTRAYTLVCVRLQGSSQCSSRRMSRRAARGDRRSRDFLSVSK